MEDKVIEIIQAIESPDRRDDLISLNSHNR